MCITEIHSRRWSLGFFVRTVVFRLRAESVNLNDIPEEPASATLKSWLVTLPSGRV